MTFLRTIRAVLRSWAVRLGLVKRKVYEYDVGLADVINRICCSHPRDGVFIVAVESRFAMIQIMSYMEKNAIPACAVTDMEIGRFPRLTLRGAINCMTASPASNQVWVMNKAIAAVGWSVPRELERAWGRVNLMTTFEPREPWATQYAGRLRSNA